MEQINKNNLIAKWLFLCCFCVALMVAIGGLTRLTESGLSMTSWHPIHGILPPLNDSQWQDEFVAYKQSPEYQKVNFSMELSEFKRIFMWEYVHRIAGRLTGTFFLLPLLFFLFTKSITGVQSFKLFSVFLIGGIQGVIGWWMVKSGLHDRPSVSHFRLAIHLFFAFFIFSILFWQGLNFYLSKAMKFTKYKFNINFLIIILSLQIIYGAFIAGLDGGLTYNTWPLMDGDLVPEGFAKNGVTSLFEDITSIQFIHRWLAFIFLVIVIHYMVKVKSDIKKDVVSGLTAKRLKKSSNLLLSLVISQIIIGIKVLIFMVPIALASMHQITALIILGNLIYIRRVING